MLRGTSLATIAIAAFAAGFHAFTAWGSRGSPIFAVWLLGWSLAPYIAAFGWGTLTKRPLIGLVAAALAIVFDVNTYLNVRSSDSSTAVLDLLWAPVWNLILVVPLGALAAFLLLKLQHGRQAAP